MSKRPAAIVIYIILGIFVVFVFAPLILSRTWIQREEYRGLKYGMTQRNVIQILAAENVTHVMPILRNQIVIAKKNVSSLEEIRSARGICVVSAEDAVDLQLEFDQTGRLLNSHYGSVRKSPELADLISRDDLISRAPALLERNAGMSLSACIPGVRWIGTGNPADMDMQYLAQYDNWAFDEPNSYSRVRLEFEARELSKIKYQWRLYEPL
jgi:hypothetical protein